MSEISLDLLYVLGLILLYVIKGLITDSNASSLAKKKIENPEPEMISVGSAMELVDKSVTSATTLVLSRFQKDNTEDLEDEKSFLESIPQLKSQMAEALTKELDEMRLFAVSCRSSILMELSALKSDVKNALLVTNARVSENTLNEKDESSEEEKQELENTLNKQKRIENTE